jgi:hypothetical protein
MYLCSPECLRDVVRKLEPMAEPSGMNTATSSAQITSSEPNTNGGPGIVCKQSTAIRFNNQVITMANKSKLFAKLLLPGNNSHLRQSFMTDWGKLVSLILGVKPWHCVFCQVILIEVDVEQVEDDAKHCRAETVTQATHAGHHALHKTCTHTDISQQVLLSDQGLAVFTLLVGVRVHRHKCADGRVCNA